MSVLLPLKQVFYYFTTLSVTSNMLCAETSWDKRDTNNVMQVVRHRVQSDLFPDSYIEVVLQRGQFTHRCRKGWLKPHHWQVAIDGVNGRRLNAHQEVRATRRTLFFLTRDRYEQLRDKWGKTRSVAHTHRQWLYVRRWKDKCKPLKTRKHRWKHRDCRRGHVYMKFTKAYLKGRKR